MRRFRLGLFVGIRRRFSNWSAVYFPQTGPAAENAGGRKERPAEPWFMRSFLIWLALLVAAAWSVSELTAAEPVLSRPLLGLGVFVLGVLGGLRLGTLSATRFVNDLLRLNRYLADQNRELAESNHMLLKEAAAKPGETGDSADPGEA